MKRKSIWILFVIINMIISGTGFALTPATSDVLKMLKDEGRLENFVNVIQSTLEQEYLADYQKLKSGEKDIPDSMHVLVVLGDFTDIKADTVHHDQEHYEDLLFSVNTYPTGSLRDYYKEVSYGKFTLNGEVTIIWAHAPHPTAYWYCNKDSIKGTSDDYGFGAIEPNVGTFIYDVLTIADPYVDFKKFDLDGDKWVDATIVVHSGPGAESTGNPNHIWSHKGGLSRIFTSAEGIKVGGYTIQPESGTIGVFAHEFGHTLGLPDLYDTDYTSSGVGNWCLMGSGSWTLAGTRPAHLSAWCKKELGFLNPVIFKTTDVQKNPIKFPRVEDNKIVYELFTDGKPVNEYWLIENRQKVLFDEGIPGDGLVIWHIDEDQGTNTLEGMDPYHVVPHYKVTVEESDCLFEKWVYWEQSEHEIPGSFALEVDPYKTGDASDAFPVGGIKNFYADSWPNTHSYLEQNSKVAVLEISAPGDTMTANLDVSQILPVLTPQTPVIIDDSPGNNDGRAEPGETSDLIIPLKNTWGNAPDVTVEISSEDPEITITSSNSSYGTINYGKTADNSSNPFQFSVGSQSEVRWVTFKLDITAMPMGKTYNFSTTIDMIVGWPQIILVDDDKGGILEKDYEEILDELNINTYDTWDVFNNSGTAVGRFRKHEIMIWFTSNQTDSTLLPEDQDSLKIFLERGGNLFLNGQNIDSDVPSSFLKDYLHAIPVTPNTKENGALGFEGDPISSKWVTNPLVFPQNSPSSIRPFNGAVSIFRYYAKKDTAGIRFDGNPSGRDHKLVYLAFSWENILDKGYRKILLDKILRWMGVGVEITDFSAARNHSDVFLEWDTSNCGCFKGFNIYRALKANASIPERVKLNRTLITEKKFTDKNVPDKQTLFYWLEAQGNDGSLIFRGPVMSTQNSPDLGYGLKLEQNHPNPFNPVTTIRFSVDKEDLISLKIYNISGSLVKTLVQGKKDPGYYSIVWNGKNEQNQEVASGIYFYRLTADSRELTQKMVLLK